MSSTRVVVGECHPVASAPTLPPTTCWRATLTPYLLLLLFLFALFFSCLFNFALVTLCNLISLACKYTVVLLDCTLYSTVMVNSCTWSPTYSLRSLSMCALTCKRNVVWIREWDHDWIKNWRVFKGSWPKEFVAKKLLKHSCHSCSRVANNEISDHTTIWSWLPRDCRWRMQLEFVVKECGVGRMV